MELVSIFLSGVAQCLLALVIAALFWAGHRGVARLRRRPGEGFGKWCGLRLPGRGLGELILLVLAGAVVGAGVTAAFWFLVPGYADLFSGEHSPAVRFLGLGSPALFFLAALVHGVLGTGFWEELLFRGVLARRLMSWLGVVPGNILQALLFTAMHNGLVALTMPAAGLGLHACTVAVVLPLALFSGWYNERRGGGSIVGSWILHGSLNFFTVLTVAALLGSSAAG